jgi:hypothetical protein
MGTILIIVLLIVVFGGGGYYGYNRYGGSGLGGVLGLVLIVFAVLWLLGRLHTAWLSDVRRADALAAVLAKSCRV